MDKTEMGKVLSEHLAGYRSRSYDELVALVRAKHVDTMQVMGPAGTEYQLEFSFFWDGKPGGDVRVIGSIDESPHRPIFRWLPIYASAVTDSFIMSPEGKFVGE